MKKVLLSSSMAVAVLFGTVSAPLMAHPSMEMEQINCDSVSLAETLQDYLYVTNERTLEVGISNSELLKEKLGSKTYAEVVMSIEKTNAYVKTEEGRQAVKQMLIMTRGTTSNIPLC